MKKRSLYLMKFAVGLTILLGVLLILMTNEKSFQKIITDDIENISKLSASIIYAEIDNSLTKPIFVAQTMASDLFLRKWLKEESPKGDDPEQTAEIQQYLMNYSKKYGYDSVAVTSAKSNVYYYQEGVNKVINKDDQHDIWYYNFIESDQLYKLNIDTDEANSNILTVFVDCKIMDKDGSILGVVGIGIKMSHLQALLKKYEVEYDLKALLIDKEGLIQVDSVDENIEVANFFSAPQTADLEESILGNKTSMEIFWYSGDGLDHCLITKYVSNLHWYIVIEKNTAGMQKVLTGQINRDLLLVAFIIALVLLMVSYVISRYNRMLLRTASMDGVTNLPNAKMFQEIFEKNTRRPACRQGYMFMFDIDNFKKINDEYGHLFGNTVLYHVSEKAKEVIGFKGVVSRWGGDEFAGVVYGSLDQAKEVLEQIATKVAEMQEGELTQLTISVGATSISSNKDLDAMLQEADSAMYRSKENGRNQVTYYANLR